MGARAHDDVFARSMGPVGFEPYWIQLHWIRSLFCRIIVGVNTASLRLERGGARKLEIDHCHDLPAEVALSNDCSEQLTRIPSE
jgi:hypothetical protein